MNRLTIQGYLLRAGIIVFWMVIFFAFLYAPLFLNYFKTDRVLNIATWSELIDAEYVREFEKESGIKVNLSYFDNNEELLLKFRATKGAGYDLILPSDYVVGFLLKEDLVKPIDKSKLNFWDRLHPRFLNAYFDPNNKYTIPFFVSLYGLAIDTEFFKSIDLKNVSWSLIFKQPEPPFTVAMSDSAREIILLGALYLFGNTNDLNKEKLHQIQELLIQQKNWVSAYSEFRADYLLLSGTSPVAIMTSPYLFRLFTLFPRFKFVVPTEGSFMVTDSFVIPKKSDKDELIYKFLNFIYSKESIKHHFTRFAFFSTTIELEEWLNEYDPSGMMAYYHFKAPNIYYFRSALTENQITKLWIALKAS